jgi:hypothetical protein
MTPAPTIWLELMMDIQNAGFAALKSGMLSMVMWPLLCRKASSHAELPEGSASAAPALPAR